MISMTCGVFINTESDRHIYKWESEGVLSCFFYLIHGAKSVHTWTNTHLLFSIPLCPCYRKVRVASVIMRAAQCTMMESSRPPSLTVCHASPHGGKKVIRTDGLSCTGPLGVLDSTRMYRWPKSQISIIPQKTKQAVSVLVSVWAHASDCVSVTVILRAHLRECLSIIPEVTRFKCLPMHEL